MQSIVFHMIIVVSTVTATLTTENKSQDCPPLNRFISCYESPTLIISEVFTKEVRSFHYAITFRAFDRAFHVKVVPKNPMNSILNPNVKINRISSRRKLSKRGSPEPIIEVTGKITRERSYVNGILLFNAFYGSIRTTNDTYFIEPMHKFDSYTTNGTVVYRASDVIYWKETMSTNRTFHPWRSKVGPFPIKDIEKDQAFMDSRVINAKTHVHKRMKRNIHPDTKICHMHVVADHTFFKYQGMYSEATTISEIVKYMAESDDVFRRTDFNGDGLGENLQFSLDEVTIYEDAQATNYYFADEKMSVDRYLDYFSKYDFDGLCLALIFTHRDFKDGVIGLAWMASSSVYAGAGGMCQERIYYYEPPFYDKGYYSFNTLLVSTMNFGETLPQTVSALTVAHEIGHSFGSPHDNEHDRNCAPNGPYGNFLMHPYASDADKPNNFEFSRCSKSQINPVILKKGKCLRYVNAGDVYCGNGVIDEGEDCDCGNVAQCYVNDQCCEPPSAGSEACTFSVSKGHYCSPSMSPCCSEDCKMYSDTDSITCQEKTECTKASFCDGNSLECPTPIALPDGVQCDDGNGICQNGKCTNNLCISKGLSDCQCTGSITEHLCQLCCLCENNTCIPAYYLGIRAKDQSILYKSPGQACGNYKGYCNEHMECSTVDAEAPMKSLMKLFSKNAAQLVYEWVANYWYLVVSAVTGIVIIAMLYKAYRSRLVETPEPINSLANQSAKMALIWQESKRQHQLITNDIIELHKKCDELIENVHKQRPMDIVEAVGRLCFFFPNTPKQVVINTARTSSCEEFAVKQMLIRGFPMRYLPFDEDEEDDNAEALDEDEEDEKEEVDQEEEEAINDDSYSESDYDELDLLDYYKEFEEDAESVV